MNMENNKIDAVLPLHPENLGRATILFRSMVKNFVPLGKLYVIVPGHALERMKPIIQREIDATVIPETEIVPEMGSLNTMAKWFSPGKVLLARRAFNGWYLQQVIKLAAAEIVKSSFYLLLDADIMVIRKVTYEDLIIGGKAVCIRQENAELHKDWYTATANEFGFASSPWRYGVTPFLFSKPAVTGLIEFLDCRRKRDWGDLPVGILAKLKDSWRSYLMRKKVWTEVSLYFEFLETNNLIERYYHPKADCLISGSSLWTPDQLEQINKPEWLESLTRGEPFLVVQSRLPISDIEVWEKVASKLGVNGERRD